MTCNGEWKTECHPNLKDEQTERFHCVFKATIGCIPDIYLYSSNGILGALLILSLCWNIYSYVSRRCSGNAICRSKTQHRQSIRQMEENPIYGNVTYTNVTPTPESDDLHSRSQPRLNADTQMYLEGTRQECYANLTLKAPRVQSSHSSPQIEYSDIIQVQDLPESEREDEGSTEEASILSDLYASVQTQRIKTIEPTGDVEGYANHL